MGNPSAFYRSSEIPIEDSSRNHMNPEILVEYRHVDGTGWFNDPTRYNILGGPRNTTTPSVEVSSEKKDKSNLTANPNTTNPHPRLSRLLRVASNINDKAEAFIHTTREKLSKMELKKF